MQKKTIKSNNNSLKEHSPTAIGHTQKTKKIKIKHHHAKPYRKRHYGSLVLSILIAVLLIVLIAQNNQRINSSIQDARNYINNMFGNVDNQQQSINSTFGFSLNIDTEQFYASAIDSATGNLYLGNELSVNRAYQVLRVSPSMTTGNINQSTLTMEYLDNYNGSLILSDIENNEYKKEINQKDSKLIKKSSKMVNIDGKQFLMSEWERQFNNAIASKLNPILITYSGVLNDKPLVVKINGIGSETKDLYKPIIDSITFSQNLNTTYNKDFKEKFLSSKSLLDNVTFSEIAKAVSSTKASSSELSSSLYSPAVVKIINIYCQDISLNGRLFVSNACNGMTGSGFFVSSDGYIATNGHVIASSPKEVAISWAMSQLLKGDEQYMGILAVISGLTEPELTNKTEKQAAGILLDKINQIPDSKFSSTNSINNLLVTLGEKQPDYKELQQLTMARKKYTTQDSILHAKIIGSDYRVFDGIDGFKASDVAIIKVDGSNYPITTLGSIDNVSQGSNIGILGYPSNASNNGLVEEEKSKVTLTSGKVSSIKNATGSDKKLIETDTTIGHGNSGGPVLDDSGLVVGIATYTIDGSGTGDGVFNYVRDIKDLKDLAAKSSVTFNTNSKTQDEWQKGINNFYNAHYSKALKNFDKVKKLYSSHPAVNEFIATSNTKIKEGKDVKDFPVVLVLIIGLFVVIAGAVISAIVIIRHKGKHNIYQQQVASGGIQPMVPGSPPQYANNSSPQPPQAQQTQPFTPQPLTPTIQTSAPVGIINPVQTPPQPTPVIAPIQQPSPPQPITSSVPQQNQPTPYQPQIIRPSVDQNQPPKV